MVTCNFKIGDVVTWSEDEDAQDYKKHWKCPDVFVIKGFFHGGARINDKPSDCVMWETNNGEYCPGASPISLMLCTGPW